MIFYSHILLMFTPACVRLTALHGCSLLFIHIPHLCVVQRQPGSMVVWWADDNKMLVELVFYNPSDIQPVRIVSGRFYFPADVGNDTIPVVIGTSETWKPVNFTQVDFLSFSSFMCFRLNGSTGVIVGSGGSGNV